MTYKTRPGRPFWRARLSGRDPILAEDEVSSGWWFRADAEGWAFQTLRRSGYVGARGTDVLVGQGSVRKEHEAAWAVIGNCLAARDADRLTVLGRVGCAAWTSEANVEISDRAPLLPGEIAGNLSAQPMGEHWPIHRFVDDRRCCRQCGENFVFTAEIQRHWYEVLKLHEDAHPVRCRRCRRERRASNAVTRRVSTAFDDVRADPDAAPAHLELARAILALRHDRGEGDPDRAVHAARTASRLDPSLRTTTKEVIAAVRGGG